MASQDLLRHFDICSHGQYENDLEETNFEVHLSSLFLQTFHLPILLRLFRIKQSKSSERLCFNRRVYVFLIYRFMR